MGILTKIQSRLHLDNKLPYLLQKEAAVRLLRPLDEENAHSGVPLPESVRRRMAHRHPLRDRQHRGHAH